MSKEPEWWKDFFEDFTPAFGMIPARQSNAQANFFVKKLNLSKGKSFLDCPCGMGRIAFPMAKKGIRVTGIDITQPYLDKIALRNTKLKLPIKTIKQDMRRITFTNRFDAAGNIWSSLGYFPKESDNQLVVKKLYNALKPGGRAVLHMINRDFILSEFIAQGWQDIGKLRLLHTARLDLETSRVFNKWHFVQDGEEVIHETNMRVYSYHELVTLMEKAGFVDIEGFSSTKGESIVKNSRMLFVFGRRPGK